MKQATKRELLTPSQIASALQVKKTTILEWSRAGRIPVIRLSKRVVRFDLDAVLEKLTVQ